jgi:hypothetical protein
MVLVRLYTGSLGKRGCGVKRRGGYVHIHFFSPWLSKILQLIELRVRDRRWVGQNLEPQGLRGKILRNKELAAGSGRLAVALVGWSRTFPILHSEFSQSRLFVTREAVEKSVHAVEIGGWSTPLTPGFRATAKDAPTASDLRRVTLCSCAGCVVALRSLRKDCRSRKFSLHRSTEHSGRRYGALPCLDLSANYPCIRLQAVPVVP